MNKIWLIILIFVSCSSVNKIHYEEYRYDIQYKLDSISKSNDIQFEFNENIIVSNIGKIVKSSIYSYVKKDSIYIYTIDIVESDTVLKIRREKHDKIEF